MIIVCPECDRRYLTDELDFAEAGRHVRCSGCGYHWFHEVASKPDFVEPLYAEIHSGDAEHKKEKKSSLKTLFILMLLGLLAIGFYTQRHLVLEAFPETSKFFEILGFEKKKNTAALVLEHITPLHPEGEDEETLILTGEVRNVSEETHQLPVLTIQAKGSCRDASWLTRLFTRSDQIGGTCVIDMWSHEWSEARLAPGETLKFETKPRKVLVKNVESIDVHF